MCVCVDTCVEVASWWNKRRTCNGVKGELGSSFERNDSTIRLFPCGQDITFRGNSLSKISFITGRPYG